MRIENFVWHQLPINRILPDNRELSGVYWWDQIFEGSQMTRVEQIESINAIEREFSRLRQVGIFGNMPSNTYERISILAEQFL